MCQFLGTWETEITFWGRVCRPDDLYHCHTNNGTESLNEDSKFKVPDGTSKSFLTLLNIIIENLTPKLYMHCTEPNVCRKSGNKG